MTVFFVPCGVSVLNNASRRNFWPEVSQARAIWFPPYDGRGTGGLAGWALQQELNQNLDRCPQWRTDERGAILDDALHGRPGQHIRYTLRQRGISAEYDSLHHSGVPAPTTGDRVVFIASDTPHGVLAAVLNAALIGGTTEVWDGPPTVGQEPATVEALLDYVPRVDVVRVQDLDPERYQTFESAMATGAQVLGWATTQQEAFDAFVLHLAGGFKATIPFLTAMAEVLPGMNLAHHVQAFCLYEQTDRAIAIPLRRLTWQQAREELDGVGAGMWTERPMLKHLAYDADGELTAIGQALRSLFDRAERGLAV